MKGLASSTAGSSPSCFGFGNGISSILSRIRRLFKYRSKKADYPPEEKEQSYRHVPVCAASDFLKTTTSMEMKRIEQLAQLAHDRL
jgi:hypothetical protein